LEPTITEIAPDVFRISIFPARGRLSFGCFLIRDDEPAMVETSFNRFFDLVHGAVKSLIDPSALRYIFVPHFEMDECGSLNRFLEIAPRAEPVCSPIGARVTIADFSQRPARALAHGEQIRLGRKTLTAIGAPWVHLWDSMLVHDETDRTLFTSDLFLQPGDREPMTDEDRSGEVIEAARLSGAFPSQKLLEHALDRIEGLQVETLACHHGSVLKGDPRRYYRALRQNPIGDIVDAEAYGGAPRRTGATSDA
jgi:flavorubredoxin